MSGADLFAWALAFTMRWERGIHRPSPSDPNPTKDGITQRYYDAVAKQQGWPAKSVYDLTDGEITRIYALLWEQAQCPALPRLLACAHFDASVNMSRPRAVRCLQFGVGATPDGLLGDRTIARAWQVPTQEAVRRAIGAREAEYRKIALDYPAKAPNLDGWLHRTSHLRAYLGAA